MITRKKKTENTEIKLKQWKPTLQSNRSLSQQSLSQLSPEMFLFNVITELYSLSAEINELLSAIMMIV